MEPLPARDDALEGYESIRERKFQPSKWDIWILGITIGLGGQYFSWNSGLHAGLYSFLLDFFVVGFAYVALCCCTSEITGALPFAGGAYGLSRCTLGYYPGFIIGCAEAGEYIVYVSTSVVALAKMIVESIPALAGFEPLLWALIYTHACYFHYRGGFIFWRWNRIIGISSLLIVLLYVVGSFPHVDFATNADNDPDYRFVDGVSGFIRHLPLACWFFVGVEALNLASDDVADATRSIPFAQIGAIGTLFGVGLLVFFVTVSLPPPGLNQVAKLLAPFDNGFQNMFNIRLEVATLFSVPGMYATTFGFMWGYGKLISAMALSKLLPPALARTSEKYDTPYVAVLCGSVLSYLMCLIVHFVPRVEEFLFFICISAAFLGYAGQCVGYIAIKRLYPSIKSSTFHSPFGVYGAVYSLIVWLLGLLSVAGFQHNYGIEFVSFLGAIGIMSLFYVTYAKSRQTFSEQETKVFFVAHVMKLRLRKGSTAAAGGNNGGLQHKTIPSKPSSKHAMAARQVMARHTPVVHIQPADLEDMAVDANGRPLSALQVKPLPRASPFHKYLSSLSLSSIEIDTHVTPQTESTTGRNDGEEGAEERNFEQAESESHATGERDSGEDNAVHEIHELMDDHSPRPRSGNSRE